VPWVSTSLVAGRFMQRGCAPRMTVYLAICRPAPTDPIWTPPSRVYERQVKASPFTAVVAVVAAASALCADGDRFVAVSRGSSTPMPRYQDQGAAADIPDASSSDLAAIRWARLGGTYPKRADAVRSRPCFWSLR
jgi:hypothetical protein